MDRAAALGDGRVHRYLGRRLRACFWNFTPNDRSKAKNNPTMYCAAKLLRLVGWAFLSLASAHAADISLERLTFTGATAPGSNAVSQNGTIFSLKFVGDETIEYQVDTTSGKPAGRGIIEVYETTSGHYPIRNGGPTYLEGVNNWTVSSSFYYNKISLVGSSIVGNTVSLEYQLNFNGNISGYYIDYSIQGKELRVHIHAKDPSKLQKDHNFNGLTFGETAELDSPVIINKHIQGALATPIILFRNGTAHYFTANTLDLLQSHAKRYDYQISTNTSTQVKVVKSFLQPPGNTGCYALLSNGQLAHALDESYVFAVSSKIKDVLVTSSAPKSGYLDMLANRFMLVAPIDQWQYYKSAWNVYSLLGLHNLAIYYFRWSASAEDDNTDQNLGPDWLPPIDPPGFVSMVANARYYGHLQSAYTTFAFLPTSSPMYSSLVGSISKDAAGNPKLYSQNGVTPLLSLDPFATVALDEYQKLKNIGLNSVYWDVESYGSIGPSPFGNPLTEEASSPAAKVHREGYAVKKKSFKAARDLLAGPMLGEGSFADPSTNMEFLWYGYADSVERAINTGSFLAAKEVPAGNILAPTNFPIIPEYEWRVAARVQVNHGNGFYDRFFGKSNGSSVVNMTTGETIMPLTQDARDLYNFFGLMYAHSGSVISNGNQQPQNPGGESGFMGFNGTAEAYFMTNALQTMIFRVPVKDILYWYNGAFRTFEDVIFTTENTTTFQHIPLHITLENGLKLWFNNSSSSLDIVDGTQTITLPSKTGFYASLPGVIQGGSFATSATSGKRIDYMWAAGQYEYFNGRGAVSAYGNINTGTAKLRKWAVYSANTVITENPVGVLSMETGAAPAVTAIEVTPPSGTMKVGEELGLLATVKYNNGSFRDATTLVKWYSTKPSVATINNAGVITAHKMGAATFLASTPTGFLILDSASITITP